MSDDPLRNPDDIPGVTPRRELGNATLADMLGLTDSDNRVQPNLEDYEPLSDDALDNILGIGDDGTLSPDVLAGALASALINDPVIYALMTAGDDNG